MVNYVYAKICIFIEHLQKSTSIIRISLHRIVRRVGQFTPYLSVSKASEPDKFDWLVVMSAEEEEWAVNSCNFLAVDKAFIKACRDNPKENDVLYFTDSKSASINSEEHLSDSLAAKAIAVIKLAIFSGNKVGEALYKEVEYVVICCVDTTMMSISILL